MSEEALTLRFSVRSGEGGESTELDIVIADALQAVLIGREGTCNLVLPSPAVSRKHATVLLRGNELVLRDHSANGCILASGARLRDAEAPLALGDVFRVGPYDVAVMSFRFAPIEGTLSMDLAEALGSLYVPPQVAIAAPQSQATPNASADNKPPYATAQGNQSVSPEGGAKSKDVGSSQRNAEDVGGRVSLRSPVVPPSIAASIPASPRVLARDRPNDSKLPSVPSLSSSLQSKYATLDVPADLRRQIRRQLLDRLDLVRLDRNALQSDEARPQVREALGLILRDVRKSLPKGLDIEVFLKELADEVLGLGPLEVLLGDPEVSEIMVVDHETIFAEIRGRLVQTRLRFTDEEATRAVIERIVTPMGRRIDESTPLVDARLKDGSRVNAVIRPLALRGPCITIRKFSSTPLLLSDLIDFGTMSSEMGRFLTRSVVVRKNILVCGGTGSGKTTLLNVLSAAIPEHERVVTVEDAAELRLSQTHVVSLETRPPNMEGKGAVSIRDLVRNALRMRPDRIIVGECRGGEAIDMLQAMNTGHEGSMTTVHANSPNEALARLETLALMSGLDLPARSIREQIAQSIHLIVYQARLSDGARKVTAIAEVVGIDDDRLVTAPIFEFVRTGTGSRGRVAGEFRTTGYLPSYLGDFIRHGLIEDGQFF